MSLRPALEPVCSSESGRSAIANLIDARARVLGGVAVRRVLPVAARRMVGPFTFLDEMSQPSFEAGEGLDVPPHPHIGLATVTYLFEGQIVHRDSLGSFQAIRPGDINWMTAGRGIVHSERTAPEHRQAGSRLHGLQLWVALPQAHEDDEPSFHHRAAPRLPEREEAGVRLKVLAGTAFGMASPVKALSPLFLVDVVMAGGTAFSLPVEHAERALYVVDGAVDCGAGRTEAGRMLVFVPGASVMVHAEASARLVLLGGAPLDGPRHIDWNFVSSSRARIEQAKRDWKEGRFPKVPGDDVEFVPLPE
jgi:redox-sensitive bicupin YhaK (pirin superfamily)